MKKVGANYQLIMLVKNSQTSLLILFVDVLFMHMNFFSNRELKRYPIADIDKLSSFSGVIFSSPEVLFVKSSYF